MKKAVYYFLPFILTVIAQPSISQVNYNSYKKSSYQWSNTAPENIPVKKIFEKEDAVYLDDQHVISVGGALGSITNVLFQRTARVKFMTQSGVEKFNTITIPQSHDPLYDYHSEPFKNNSIKKGPDFFESTLESFAARIIKPDGRIIEANIQDVYKYKEVLSIILRQDVTYKYFKSYYWDFVCKNLEVGDELEYSYRLIVPYDENYLNFNSFRIFFHGEIPRQNYSLILKYKTGPTHEIFFENQATPDSSWLEDNVQYFSWLKKDLYGCMDEAGAQPYRSLPFISVSLNTRSELFRYNDAVTSKFKYVPYWLAIIRIRESFDYEMRKNAAINLKDKQNLLIDAFVRNQTAGIADSLHYLKFIKVHSTIADSFKYVNDEMLFREEDNRAERMGEFTESYKIREISRYKLYAKIINELQLDYFTFYLMDKRYGKIDNHYQSPIWNNEGLYATYVNKSFSMVHPKKSDFGWYVEELPFYWENISGLLLNYNDLFYDLLEKPRIIKTAQSNLNENTRMCNVKAEVNFDQASVSFDAKVNLSGQYSTMTRSLYTLSIADSINNPMYRKKISGISNNCKIISEEITTHNNTFPYKFDLRTAYTSNDVITKNSDSTFTLDLGGWFNHIMYTALDTNQRQLEFYPDFVGQDTYRYYLKFDKPVTIVNSIETASIKNTLGQLSVSISQPQPDGILIESHFVTSSDVVPADKIAEVSAIYNTIHKLNSSKLLLKL